VAAVGALALLVTFALALLRSEPRSSGTDYTPPEAFSITLPAGQVVCQAHELLPADTAAVQLTIGTLGAPGPPLTLTATGPSGRPLTRGALATGWREGVVRIPVQRVSHPTNEARVCLHVAAAPHGSTVELSGKTQPGYSVEINGRTFLGPQMRIDYLRPGTESWYQLLPTIVHRFSLAKPGFLRVWEWVAALLLVLATGFLAIRTVLRSAASSERGA
jgi:hypothetical protein